jgi:hypothetical protein
VRWLHPITNVREWLRWRESILVVEEDAAIGVAREQARTPEERAFVERIIEERERSPRVTDPSRS